jgi:peptidoglycan-associated lipoprotein
MMKKVVFRSFLLLAVVAFASFSTGCKTKPSAEMYGSGGNLYGGEILEGDIPLEGDNLSLPADGNRDMFQPVYFAYDSSQINPEEAGKLEAVADYLKKHKNSGVIVEGHCDARGSREYNQALGERRALAARDYLVSLGVDPGRIQTRSMGEEMPADPGHNEAAWRLNRRDVFVIY